jgi:hypothetical protein
MARTRPPTKPLSQLGGYVTEIELRKQLSCSNPPVAGEGGEGGLKSELKRMWKQLPRAKVLVLWLKTNP